MNVYILTAHRCDNYLTLGVFSSYSAMITWLKQKYGCKADTTGFSTLDSGSFVETITTHDVGGWQLTYDSHRFIGEHSVKTNKIEFK